MASVASSLSENLLLEYVEGLPLAEVGWGRVSPATLAAIMPLHDRYADLTRRAPDIAARNGAPLARQILVAIDNGASGAAIDNGASAAVTDAAPIPPAARFVALLGHDTNLSNIGGMLGIDWALPDQPDKTAPDTALAFELWRDPVDGSRYVRVVVHYQTLEQLRQLAALDADHPAPRVAVAIAGCGDPATGLCPLPRFHAMLEDAMPRACF